MHASFEYSPQRSHVTKSRTGVKLTVLFGSHREQASSMRSLTLSDHRTTEHTRTELNRTEQNRPVSWGALSLLRISVPGLVKPLAQSTVVYRGRVPQHTELEEDYQTL